MSQQPKKPDLFDSLEDDPAGDPPTGTYIAPDEPMGSHAYGTTSAEARHGETFADRDRHTEPEVSEVDIDEAAVGRLSQDGDEDVDRTDDEAAMAARADAEDSDDLSAEEQAVHRTDS